MKSTPSPRVRFLAVLALVLLAGAGAYLLITGSSKKSAASDTAGTQVTSRTTTQTQTTAKKSSKSHKRKHTTSVEGVAALDHALGDHPVVVVSVYARGVATDNAAMNEAKAGAAEVGAGFVAFNIYEEKLARQLGTLLGSSAQVTNPSVLFFKRPRTLAFTLTGFADRQVVAQAAHNVFPQEEPWVRDANKICGRFTVPLATAMAKSKNANINTAAGRNNTAAALDEVIALLDQVTKSLSAVRTNVSAAKDYAQFLSDLRQLATDMSSEAAALRRNDLTTGKTIVQTEVALAETASNLATNLQITSCAP